MDGIRAAGCGVLVWLARDKDPNVDLSAVAKHGAFTICFGKRNQLIPFWDEVANGELTSIVTIYWQASSLARGRAIRTAETSTSQGIYITLNAAEPLAATIRMLASFMPGNPTGKPAVRGKVPGSS